MMHPERELQAGTPREAAWSDAPREVFSWMVSEDPPPAGLSAWAYAPNWNGLENPEGDGAPRLDLPTIVADGQRTAFRFVEIRIGPAAVAVVYHPGWPITHVAEAAGTAVRLWPPRAGASLASLPETARPIVWSTGPELLFRPGVFGSMTCHHLHPGWTREVKWLNSCRPETKRGTEWRPGAGARGHGGATVIIGRCGHNDAAPSNRVRIYPTRQEVKRPCASGARPVVSADVP